MTPSQPSARALVHGSASCERRDPLNWRAKRNRFEQRLALFERQPGHVAPIEPEDVEHVVGSLPVPGDLTIENGVIDRELCDSFREPGNVLGQAVAREETHVVALFEGEQPDAVELPLEDPVGSGEALLGERRRHRFQPVGKIIHGHVPLL